LSRYFIFFLLSFTFIGCTFSNPFAPPHSYPSHSENISNEIISTDPMYRATMRPYTVFGKEYHPQVVNVGDTFLGIASWYGDDFHNKQTSNGEYYDMHDLTAAHKTMPINTVVKVTNLSNNLSTIVRINDRGPFVGKRIIDLSYKAATDIDMIKHGTAKVKVEVLVYDGASDKHEHKKMQVKKSNKKNWKLYKVEKKEELLTKSEFLIQIASFSSKEKALKLKEKCYNDFVNYAVFIKEVNINNQGIYKVMLSGFKTLQDARDFIDKEHFSGAFVVRN